MKLISFFFLAIALALTNCSNRNTQDDVLVNCMIITIEDQEKWIVALQNFNAQKEISQQELRRIYFSNHATSSSAYSNVSMVVQYFDINRDFTLNYRNQLDQRDHLSGSFYTCDKIEDEIAQKLLRIELQIVDLLNNIKSNYKFN